MKINKKAQEELFEESWRLSIPFNKEIAEAIKNLSEEEREEIWKQMSQEATQLIDEEILRDLRLIKEAGDLKNGK